MILLALICFLGAKPPLAHTPQSQPEIYTQACHADEVPVRAYANHVTCKKASR